GNRTQYVPHRSQRRAGPRMARPARTRTRRGGASGAARSRRLTAPCAPDATTTTRSLRLMPLPKLPTRMGTVLSIAEDAVEADPVIAPAPVEPPAARQPAESRATPPATPAKQPNLAVVKPKGAKKTRLPSSRRKLFVLDTNVLLHDS